MIRAICWFIVSSLRGFFWPAPIPGQRYSFSDYEPRNPFDERAIYPSDVIVLAVSADRKFVQYRELGERQNVNSCDRGCFNFSYRPKPPSEPIK